MGKSAGEVKKRTGGARAKPDMAARENAELRRQLTRTETALRAESKRLSRLSASAAVWKEQSRTRIRQREALLAQKVKRLSILYEVGGMMSSTLDLDALLQLIVRLAARHLKARKASLMLVEEAGHMRINSSVGIRSWIVAKTRITVGEGIAGTVAATGSPILIRDISSDPHYKRPSRTTYRTGSFICVPLKRQEKILGVLNVSDKRSQEQFDEDDLHLVTTLAAQAAIAVENARLYADVKEQMAFLEQANRSLDNERGKLRTLVNSLGDAILAVDPEGHALFVNSRARTLFGLGPKAPIGGRLAELLGGLPLVKDVTRVVEAALSGASSRLETTYVREGGAPKAYLEVAAYPLRETKGEFLGALAILRDITENKELDRIRTDFLTRASHQLKTPVGLIQGFADTIIKHPDLDPEKRLHFLQLINAESHRLTHLIEEFLDFTRIEANVMRVEMERTSVEAVLDEVLPAVRARAGVKRITIQSRVEGQPPAFDTDPRCLAEVLRNVLDNGLKFTPAGGEISIVARAAEGLLTISVSDTGSGIAEADMPRIFDKYYTVNAGGGGTGLGLYIAREIVDSLGGSISLHSRAGEGTTVVITLPLDEGGPAAANMDHGKRKA